MAGQSQLHEAARAWGNAGFAVFPCVPGTKRPATKNGLHDATSNLDQIDRWWSQADYNIGVSPDSTAMFVVDVDPPLGVETLSRLEEANGNLPTTLTIQTPRGGLHYWFTGSCPSSVAKLGPKLDTRGEGGYVLVPPSVVNGVEYTYAGETDEIAEGPLWIAASLHSDAERTQAAPDIEFDLPANMDRARSLLRDYVARGHVAIEGAGGDNTTYQVACEVLNIGLSPQTAWELLRDDWNPHCVPPWEAQELADKVANASEYAQNDPGAWGVPPATEIFEHIRAKFCVSEDARKRSRFYPYALNETEAFKPPAWIIPGLIPRGGTVQIIGKQKSFKTFLTLDMALAIASGTTTFGEAPAQGSVVYAAGENADAMALHHVPAWRNTRGQEQDFPFYIVPAVPRIMVPGSCTEFIREIKARDIAPSVVVIDTMTRAMRGADENSAKDMGLFSGMCEEIQSELGCTIIVIRHTGKDEQRGGRGSNVLEGDFDTTLLVARHEKSLSVAVHVKEQRNAQEPEQPFTFRGRVIGQSLVFDQTDTFEHRATTQEADPLNTAKVGEALAKLGSPVTTQVLADALCPPMQSDSGEAFRDASQGFRKRLEGRRYKDLRAYWSGDGRSLRWAVPLTDEI